MTEFSVHQWIESKQSGFDTDWEDTSILELAPVFPRRRRQVHFDSSQSCCVIERRLMLLIPAIESSGRTDGPTASAQGII